MTRPHQSISTDVVECRRKIELTEEKSHRDTRTIRKVDEIRAEEPYASVSVITPPALMSVDEITHNSSQAYHYLNLQALESHLDRLRDQHDIIILDLPDLTTTADARIVSVIVDYVILTVGDRQNVTLDVLGAAIASCSGIHADAVGVVFNTPRHPRTTAPRALLSSTSRMESPRNSLRSRFTKLASSLATLQWSKS